MAYKYDPSRNNGNDNRNYLKHRHNLRPLNKFGNVSNAYGTLDAHVCVLFDAGFTYKHAVKLALKDRLQGTYNYHVPPYSYHDSVELINNVVSTVRDIVENQRIAYEHELLPAHRDYAVSWGA
jgi:hypothetical protein